MSPTKPQTTSLLKRTWVRNLNQHRWRSRTSLKSRNVQVMTRWIRTNLHHNLSLQTINQFLQRILRTLITLK